MKKVPLPHTPPPNTFTFVSVYYHEHPDLMQIAGGRTSGNLLRAVTQGLVPFSRGTEARIRTALRHTALSYVHKGACFTV